MAAQTTKVFNYIILVILNYQLNIIITIFGIIFFIIAFYRNAAVQSVSASLSASCWFFLSIELLNFIKNSYYNRKFFKFFGKNIDNKMTFVYPEFCLSESALKVLKRGQIHDQNIYTKPSPAFSPKNHFIDIKTCTALNDIEALIQLVALFSEKTGKMPNILSDTAAINKIHSSFISFGFSSNECTHVYMHKANTRLFSIIENKGNVRFKDSISVSIENEGGDDNKTEKIFSSNDKFQIGLIWKYHPDVEEDTDIVWIYCAGLGPLGTTGAASYLAKRWEKIYREVGDEDFLAVIKVHFFSKDEQELILLRTEKKVIMRHDEVSE